MGWWWWGGGGGSGYLTTLHYIIGRGDPTPVWPLSLYSPEESWEEALCWSGWSQEAPGCLYFSGCPSLHSMGCDTVSITRCKHPWKKWRCGISVSIPPLSLLPLPPLPPLSLPFPPHLSSLSPSLLFSPSLPPQMDFSWWSCVSCLVVTSLVQVADFYTTSIAFSKVDHHRLSCISSLSTFISAFSIACLIWWLLPPALDHTLSVGVIIGAFLFILATPSLTRPLSRSHGILVGYSAMGLPLYQSHQKTPASILKAIRPALIKIMENPDSRRIFYFLILNLVCEL